MLRFPGSNSAVFKDALGQLRAWSRRPRLCCARFRWQLCGDGVSSPPPHLQSPADIRKRLIPMAWRPQEANPRRMRGEAEAAPVEKGVSCSADPRVSPERERRNEFVLRNGA